MKLTPWLCGGGAVALLLACSSDDAATLQSGIQLSIATDGSVTPDRVNVRVASATSVFYAADIAIGTSPLPRTLTIGATGTASIVVQAWNGSTPLDRRDLAVPELPSDRLVSYAVVLGGKCTQHVTAGADGSIVSDCAAGTTCDPATGSCGSSVPIEVPGTGPGDVPDGGDGGGGNGRCTEGATRCTDRSVERCTPAGQWVLAENCEFVCRAGACAGECVPGTTLCCADVVGADGKTERRCDAEDWSSACIKGSGPTCTTEGSPARVYLSRCTADGERVVGADCATGAVAYPDGTLPVACGKCPGTQAQACIKQSDSTCFGN